MYRLLPSFLLIWSYNYDHLPYMNASNWALKLFITHLVMLWCQEANEGSCKLLCLRMYSRAFMGLPGTLGYAVSHQAPPCLPYTQPRAQKVRGKSRRCHKYTPQPFPDTKRKRKQTKPNKRKSNKRTKNTKINSLFPNKVIAMLKGLKNTRTK